jgi:hypothetical protein
MMSLLVREALKNALNSKNPATTKKHVQTAYELLSLFVDDMQSWPEEDKVDHVN